MTLPMLKITGPAAGRPLVFLPGWGFDGRVLTLSGAAGSPKGSAAAAAPAGLIDPVTLPAALIAWLDGCGIRQCNLLGWSMGGLCALEIARRWPERVASLTLLAVRAAWPLAEIAAIQAELARQPREFMSSFYRKCFLGYRAAYRRFQQELESDYLELVLAAPQLLQRGLELLAAPVRLPAPGGRYAVHCLHGRRDLIAPLAERLLLPGAEIRVLEHAGHPLFLDHWPDGLAGRSGAWS